MNVFIKCPSYFVSQYSPSIRPFLQTVVISMVSYGETYGKQQSGLGEFFILFRMLSKVTFPSSEWAFLPLTIFKISICPPLGTAALSLLTSGKYVIDPELRGAEFERITQNLDMQFWKSFWNLTESGLLTVGRITDSFFCLSFT